MTYTCFTIGYSGLWVGDLVRWAERQEVIVVDVRFSPRSRRPEWCKSRLMDRLGARYLWMGETFGNKEYRSLDRDACDLADPVRGVRIAARLLQTRSICLLCLEANHWACHRAEVADLISEETGVTLEPLTARDLDMQGRLAL